MAFVGSQKDSQTTVGNGTQVEPVLLAVKIFAVQSVKPLPLNVDFWKLGLGSGHYTTY